ncbi:MAG: hypothetical protein IIV44_05360 [Rikenellaceae bacterium]|nr:hypothetical protein [Clostridia bacterium]MBQ5679335.1 hypothetical protein [Rikenellaceae bacterium]
MKKEQKIIELRRAAKLKVAELQTKIAFARSEAAGKRARLMWERAAELDGLEVASIERYDVLAKYRAKLAGVNEQLAATVAQLKFEMQQTKSECERRCSSAEDDPEPENEQPQQDTVYCDGSEHTARIVARRLINKMPNIPADGFLFVHIIRKRDGDFFVGVTESGESVEKHIDMNFTKNTHTANVEAAFVERARRLFAEEQESGNSHVAEPLSHALDAVFGGNPVEQVESLISDTIRDGKEGGNE